jgi:hypothetical protein
MALPLKWRFSSLTAIDRVIELELKGLVAREMNLSVPRKEGALR